MSENLNIVCYGEVLFDIFPTHTKIGGAPLNVALRLASLGVNAKIISRIGNDAIGKKLLDFVSKNNIETNTIQIDTDLPTGEVFVKLDEKGSASYTINYPAAWDKIESNETTKNCIKNADALIFGSLVCRDVVSFQTLKDLLSISKFKIVDVNLRKPFYSKEILLELMNLTDFIKCNDEELQEICTFFNSPFQSIEENMIFLSEQTNTKAVCVTKGSNGAVLYFENKFYYNTGYQVKVVDTVGAGDSFLAGLISKLLSEKDPQQALNFGCAIGALVAKSEGANPKISKEEILKIMK